MAPSCGSSALAQHRVRSCPFAGHGVGGEAMVNELEPSYFPQSSSAWLYSRVIPASSKGALPWGLDRALVSLLGLLALAQPSNAPRQCHSWTRSCTFSLAQRCLLLRAPMRWQTLGSPLSCVCHFGSKNHPWLFRLPGCVRTQHQPWIWAQRELWDFSEAGCAEENLVCGVRG